MGKGKVINTIHPVREFLYMSAIDMNLQSTENSLVMYFINTRRIMFIQMAVGRFPYETVSIAHLLCFFSISIMLCSFLFHFKIVPIHWLLLHYVWKYDQLKYWLHRCYCSVSHFIYLCRQTRIRQRFVYFFIHVLVRVFPSFFRVRARINLIVTMPYFIASLGVC